MKRRTSIGAAVLLLSLTGCSALPLPGGGTLGPRFIGPEAPSGVSRAKQPVSGLVVGHRLMAVGEYELALKAYLRAAGEIGTTPEVLTALGSANFKLGRLGQAERLLRRATREDPDLVPAWNNLGVLLMERNEAPEAKEVFRRAYALDSGRSDAVRENLLRAIALSEQRAYDPGIETEAALMRVDRGVYRLITANQDGEQ